MAPTTIIKQIRLFFASTARQKTPSRKKLRAPFETARASRERGGTEPRASIELRRRFLLRTKFNPKPIAQRTDREGTGDGDLRVAHSTSRLSDLCRDAPLFLPLAIGGGKNTSCLHFFPRNKLPTFIVRRLFRVPSLARHAQLVNF